MTVNSYERFADIYDDVNNDDFVAQLIHVLGHYARRFPPPGRRMLDLACGTGTVALHFAERGWRVEGVDFSDAMLARARAKIDAVRAKVDATQAGAAGPSIRLRQGDMRSFELDEPVDLVTCNADSINHLASEEDVAATFECVARCLTPGGVFIFDLNTPYTLKNRWEGDTVTGRRGEVSYSWQPKFDEESGTCVFDATFRIDRGGKQIVMTEQIRERVFEIDRIGELLGDAGLGVLDVVDFFTLRPLVAETVRATFVAAKPV